MKSMFPLANVLWTKVQGKIHFYVRLYPHPRDPDSLMGLDGVKQVKGPEWRRSQWERAEAR